MYRSYCTAWCFWNTVECIGNLWCWREASNDDNDDDDENDDDESHITHTHTHKYIACSPVTERHISHIR